MIGRQILYKQSIERQAIESPWATHRKSSIHPPSYCASLRRTDDRTPPLAASSDTTSGHRAKCGACLASATGECASGYGPPVHFDPIAPLERKAPTVLPTLDVPLWLRKSRGRGGRATTSQAAWETGRREFCRGAENEAVYHWVRWGGASNIHGLPHEGWGSNGRWRAAYSHSAIQRPWQEGGGANSGCGKS